MKIGKTINSEQLRVPEQQIKHNRQVLCRLLDAILFLAKQTLPLRGHRESFRSTRLPEYDNSCGGNIVNEGNFLELLKLLSQYDSILAHHLATAPKNASYLSQDIPNDFIFSLAENVKDKIISQLKAAHYYGIILDSIYHRYCSR